VNNSATTARPLSTPHAVLMSYTAIRQHPGDRSTDSGQTSGCRVSHAGDQHDTLDVNGGPFTTRFTARSAASHSHHTCAALLDASTCRLSQGRRRRLTWSIPAPTASRPMGIVSIRRSPSTSAIVPHLCGQGRTAITVECSGRSVVQVSPRAVDGLQDSATINGRQRAGTRCATYRSARGRGATCAAGPGRLGQRTGQDLATMVAKAVYPNRRTPSAPDLDRSAWRGLTPPVLAGPRPWPPHGPTDRVARSPYRRLSAPHPQAIAGQRGAPPGTRTRTAGTERLMTCRPMTGP